MFGSPYRLPKSSYLYEIWKGMSSNYFLISFKNHLHIFSLYSLGSDHTFYFHKHACLRNFPEISETENSGSGYGSRFNEYGSETLEPPICFGQLFNWGGDRLRSALLHFSEWKLFMAKHLFVFSTFFTFSLWILLFWSSCSFAVTIT